MWRSKASLLIFFALVSAYMAAEDAPSRLSQGPNKCENTIGGRWYVADDTGTVCPRDSLDYATGCCSTGDRHSCDTCSLDDLCCSQYERCVSCCLRPDHGAQEQLMRAYRGKDKPETGLWKTPFEYCAAACRTTSRSTEHENAFISDRRFCFSKQGRPHTPAPPTPPLPEGIFVRGGGDGQSCDQACAVKMGRCVVRALASLNSCNVLREHFMCEAGCEPSQRGQRQFPGYVVPGAPKSMWPAQCATLAPTVPGTPPPFNCSTSAPGVKRLCACEAAPVEQPQPTTAAGGAAAQQGQSVGGGQAVGVAGQAAAQSQVPGGAAATNQGAGVASAQQQQQQIAAQQTNAVAASVQQPASLTQLEVQQASGAAQQTPQVPTSLSQPVTQQQQQQLPQAQDQ